MEQPRFFKHFPKKDTCIICGTNDDKKCVLIGIAGTEEGKIQQAVPIHFDCYKARVTHAVWVKHLDMIAFPAKVDTPIEVSEDGKKD